MSTFFGVFNRNGKTVNKETIDVIQDAMSYWEPDAQNAWINGSIALAHSMLWNTPESKFEHFPLKSDICVLTMDARIDNRNELAKELDLPNRPLSEVGDSEFILAAYKKWGNECPQYLVGDFSFVIWDELKEQLFCARDQIGVKQLYYHLSDDIFIVGNDLKVLSEYPDISQEISDEAVANYIVNHNLISNRLTFFNSFVKLPPAHSLIVSKQNIEEQCYWKLENTPELVLPDAEACARKLRELLEQAVYARLRSNYPVTSHLSGGIDSSSIAVLAARKLQEKGEKLLAFNWLHEPEDGEESAHYEWANSKRIADAEGIDHHYASLDEEDIYKYMNSHDIAYGSTTVFWYEYLVREAAQNKNSRTILSGWGGDELASYHGQSFYADLLIHGKFHRLFNELNVRLKKKKGIRPKLGFIFYRLIIPLVPRNLFSKMTRYFRVESSFAFVKKEFMPKVEQECAKPRSQTMKPQKTIRDHMLSYLENGHIQSRIEAWAVASRDNKLEYSYPLLDKRILEFIIAIPAKFFVKDTVGRYLFRLAIQGLLPEDIIWGNTKLEQHRVDSLVSLTLSLFKWYAKKGKVQTVEKYMDGKELDDLLNQFDKSSNKKADISTIMDIEVLMHLTNSAKINNRAA